MSNNKPRVKVPDKVKAGEVVTIKTLISHTMESGQRTDKKTGEKVPRMIINAFKVTFNGEEIFAVDMEPAVSANPYVQFKAKFAESGMLEFTWIDDDGGVYKTQKKIEVTG